MQQPQRLTLDRLDTPIGELQIIADLEGNLRVVHWTDHEEGLHCWLKAHFGREGYSLENVAVRSDLTDAVARYFAGELNAIDELPVKTEGTAFQQEVWRELRRIPCGSTISYGQLAKKIGRPAAVRAVGLANGSNPIGVVVPCHRVIGADGSLTGYGGGMERKAWLLRHGKRVVFPSGSCAGLSLTMWSWNRHRDRNVGFAAFGRLQRSGRS
ncbi:MAG: methylated-DNA--[protein]-cysteine S-methyltransferase [Terracidiphilus sp.]